MAELTHDMMRRGDGTWTCVDCGRSGTIAEVNAVRCPVEKKDNRNLLDAIAGTGKFAKR